MNKHHGVAKLAIVRSGQNYTQVVERGSRTEQSVSPKVGA